jgi:hypothetical protein
MAAAASDATASAPRRIAAAVCDARGRQPGPAAGGLQYGTLPAGVDVGAIVARHTPPAG